MILIIRSYYGLDPMLGVIPFYGIRPRKGGLSYDPREAIDAAARYLRDLLKKFGGRLDLALAAYNAGEGTVESFRTGRPLVLASRKIINPGRRVTGGIRPYRETQDYVRSAIAFLTSGQMKDGELSAFLFQVGKSRPLIKTQTLRLDSLNEHKHSSPSSRHACYTSVGAVSNFWSSF